MPFAEINGTSIHYHVHGNGIPIIMIHPPLLTMANFNYQKAELTDMFQVITFDIRGHGHSAYSAAPVTYPLIVEDIKQLMDCLGVEQAYLCGYSTGGSIILEAFLMYPDRFTGGIVISAMSEVSDWWLKSKISLAIGSTFMKAKDTLAVPICVANADNPTTYNNLIKDAKNGYVKNWHEYYKYSLYYNCTDKLHSIKAPMLLIYGDKDKGFLRYAHMMQQRLHDSELLIIKGLNHQIPTKAPTVMNAKIKEWVARKEAARRKEPVAADEFLFPLPEQLEQTVIYDS